MTMERPHPEPDVSTTTDPAVEEQAAAWLVRRQNGLNARDEAALQAWLAHRAAHRRAFEQLADIWQALDGIAQQDVARLRAGIRHDAGPKRAQAAAALTSPARRAFMPRFAAAGTAFAAVGAGVIGWDYWQKMPTFSAVYETRRGELQTVALPDGSTMALDTETHAEVRLYRHRREVRLVRGQAMFTVQSDPDCRFDVLARAVTVTVVGTRFSVRCTETGLVHGNVRIDVEEGRVRVACAPRMVELTAGQSVATDEAGALQQIARISPGEVASWREGRVSFDNTTLLRALQEFARYGPTNIVVDDPAVAAMRLTGSFDVHQLDRFAHALPRVLPVRLRARGDLVEIVRSA
jgi:transmembrane sensor